MNPSPLRYPGGKYKLYNFVSNMVMENGCSSYIEPFCGGSALSFALLFNNIVKRIIINDYDFTIYCFWKSVLDDTEELIKKIQETDVTIDEWYRQKEIRHNLNDHSLLDIGFSTFFLNRTNRSGIIDKARPIGGLNQNGNYSIDCRFNKSTLIKQIHRIAEKRNQISVHNMEAIDFIEEVILDTRNSFVFFDPPYYGKGPDLYTNFYTHNDHMKLSQSILHKMKNRKWIVTYDNNNEIKSLYTGVDSIEFKLNYSLQEKKAGSEIMFFSSKIKRIVNEANYVCTL